MRIWLGQINPTVGDFAGNLALLRGGIARAAAAGAELAVFPELSISGYPPRDLLEKSAFIRDAKDALWTLASETRGIEVLVGAPLPNESGRGNLLFNTAVLLRDGGVSAVVRKLLLPTYDVFDEDRHFEPGERVEPVMIRGVPVGITICEDAWSDPGLFHRKLYDRAPVDELAAAGAKVIVNLSASPFSLGRPALREEIMRGHARRLGVPVICVNQVGASDEVLFDGSSIAADGTGRVLARLRAFEEDGALVSVPAPAAAEADPDPPPVRPPADEALDALVMGTRDYVKKCGFESVTLGLSGGIDSAVVAGVAALALGPGAVTAVSMPGRFTSEASIADAAALAAALGIGLRTLPIDRLFQAYLDELAPQFAGTRADATEENIQARIRGNLLMALSNKHGWLVLTTGNKSEMAVGYCTLYGDMSGGLAVLGDVPKTLVYEVGRRINARAGRAVIPERIFTRPPTAELRAGQTDQDTLPPYAVLDRILALYVEEHRPARRIIEAGFDAGVVRDVVRRVDGNEYKRQQAAPPLRITTKAFGIGRRMPIAQRYREL